jgi:hypothetical protein
MQMESVAVGPPAVCGARLRAVSLYAPQNQFCYG